MMNEITFFENQCRKLLVENQRPDVEPQDRDRAP